MASAGRLSSLACKEPLLSKIKSIYKYPIFFLYWIRLKEFYFFAYILCNRVEIKMRSFQMIFSHQHPQKWAEKVRSLCSALSAGAWEGHGGVPAGVWSVPLLLCCLSFFLLSSAFLKAINKD